MKELDTFGIEVTVSRPPKAVQKQLAKLSLEDIAQMRHDVNNRFAELPPEEVSRITRLLGYLSYDRANDAA